MEKIELFNYKKNLFFSSTFRCILNKSLIINNSTSKTNTKLMSDELDIVIMKNMILFYFINSFV